MKPIEWLRLITPILLGICLFIVEDIRANQIKLETDFNKFRVEIIERVTRIETKVDDGKRTLREDLSDLPSKSSNGRTLDRIQRLN